MDSDWPARHVLVAGARVAGVPAALALAERGARVDVVDRTPSTDPRLAAADVSVSDVPDTVPAGVDLVVASPGFRPTHPLLVDAGRRGVEVIGEIELAWRLRGPDAAAWLLITGTNGKTTTTRMTAALLTATGRRAAAVGNVGVSVIDAVLGPDRYDVLAVEVSSQQLHFVTTVAPAAAVLLNLAPDHLDWHGSFAAYAAAKATVWRHAGVAVGNADDPAVAALPRPAGTTPVGFTLGPPADGQLGVVDAVAVDRAFADPAAELFGTDVVRPAGAHNVANALAAAALVRALGGTPEQVQAGLTAFVPDPHRNQYVAEVGGVVYVDDSKATNPHAAAASLATYDPVVWVAGGQLKGVDVAPLVAQFAGRLRAAVLLGADRAEIAAALARHAPDVPVVTVDLTDDRAMPSVVAAAARLARPGDTVLLAPAAASYDMFTGYGARGDHFAAAVHQLPAPSAG